MGFLVALHFWRVRKDGGLSAPPDRLHRRVLAWPHLVFRELLVLILVLVHAFSSTRRARPRPHEAGGRGPRGLPPEPAGEKGKRAVSNVGSPAGHGGSVFRPRYEIGIVLSAVALLSGACRAPAPPARNAVQEEFREGALTAREARGHRVFRQRCATCHGPEGRGDGQNAYNLRPPPPDFHESLVRLSPADRRKVVEKGKAALGRSPLCPPWGRSLAPDDVDAVLAWLDAASRPKAVAPDLEASAGTHRR